MIGEKISLLKAVTSVIKPVFWIKCLMIGLGIFAIVITGYAYYKAFIKKPLPSTTQNAEQIINHNYYPTVKPGFGGCVRMQIPVKNK